MAGKEGKVKFETQGSPAASTQAAARGFKPSQFEAPFRDQNGDPPGSKAFLDGASGVGAGRFAHGSYLLSTVSSSRPGSQVSRMTDDNQSPAQHQAGTAFVAIGGDFRRANGSRGCEAQIHPAVPSSREHVLRLTMTGKKGNSRGRKVKYETPGSPAASTQAAARGFKPSQFEAPFRDHNGDPPGSKAFLDGASGVGAGRFAHGSYLPSTVSSSRPGSQVSRVTDDNNPSSAQHQAGTAFVAIGGDFRRANGSRGCEAQIHPAVPSSREHVLRLTMTGKKGNSRGRKVKYETPGSPAASTQAAARGFKPSQFEAPFRDHNGDPPCSKAFLDGASGVGAGRFAHGSYLPSTVSSSRPESQVSRVTGDDNPSPAQHQAGTAFVAIGGDFRRANGSRGCEAQIHPAVPSSREHVLRLTMAGKKGQSRGRKVKFETPGSPAASTQAAARGFKPSQFEAPFRDHNGDPPGSKAFLDGASGVGAGRFAHGSYLPSTVSSSRPGSQVSRVTDDNNPSSAQHQAGTAFVAIGGDFRRANGSRGCEAQIHPAVPSSREHMLRLTMTGKKGNSRGRKVTYETPGSPAASTQAAARGFKPSQFEAPFRDHNGDPPCSKAFLDGASGVGAGRFAHGSYLPSTVSSSRPGSQVSRVTDDNNPSSAQHQAGTAFVAIGGDFRHANGSRGCEAQIHPAVPSSREHVLRLTMTGKKGNSRGRKVKYETPGSPAASTQAAARGFKPSQFEAPFRDHNGDPPGSKAFLDGASGVGAGRFAHGSYLPSTVSSSRPGSQVSRVTDDNNPSSAQHQAGTAFVAIGGDFRHANGSRGCEAQIHPAVPSSREHVLRLTMTGKKGNSRGRKVKFETPGSPAASTQAAARGFKPSQFEAPFRDHNGDPPGSKAFLDGASGVGAGRFAHGSYLPSIVSSSRPGSQVSRMTDDNPSPAQHQAGTAFVAIGGDFRHANGSRGCEAQIHPAVPSSREHVLRLTMTGKKGNSRGRKVKYETPGSPAALTQAAARGFKPSQFEAPFRDHNGDPPCSKASLDGASSVGADRFAHGSYVPSTVSSSRPGSQISRVTGDNNPSPAQHQAGTVFVAIGGEFWHTNGSGGREADWRMRPSGDRDTGGDRDRPGGDDCHNGESLSGSLYLRQSATRKWSWLGYSAKQFRSFAQECPPALDIGADQVRAKIDDVRCRTCRDSLHNALGTFLARGGLPLTKLVKLAGCRSREDTKQWEGSTTGTQLGAESANERAASSSLPDGRSQIASHTKCGAGAVDRLRIRAPINLDLLRQIIGVVQAAGSAAVAPVVSSPVGGIDAIKSPGSGTAGRRLRDLSVEEWFSAHPASSVARLEGDACNGLKGTGTGSLAIVRAQPSVSVAGGEQNYWALMERAERAKYSAFKCCGVIEVTTGVGVQDPTAAGNGGVAASGLAGVGTVSRVSSGSVAGSGGGSAIAANMDWNPQLAPRLQEAETALVDWLTELTMALHGMTFQLTLAFMRDEGVAERGGDCGGKSGGGRYDLADSIALTEVLWTAYEESIKRQLDLTLEARREHLREQSHPTGFALCFAAQNRACAAELLERKRAEMTALHEATIGVMRAGKVQPLLVRAERARQRWPDLLVDEELHALDDLAERVLKARLQIFKGESFAYNASNDVIQAEQMADAQLEAVVQEWEGRMDNFKVVVENRFSEELNPTVYPQSPESTAALQSRLSSFKTDWEGSETTQQLHAHIRQRHVQGLCQTLVVRKRQLKASKQEAAKLERQRRKRDGEARVSTSNCNGSANGVYSASSEQSASLVKQRELEERCQSLVTAISLTQQEQIETCLTYRVFAVGQLHQRYRRLRLFFAQLVCRAAARVHVTRHLCGVDSHADERVKMLGACLMLGAVEEACLRWTAVQNERQVVEGTDRESSRGSSRGGSRRGARRSTSFLDEPPVFDWGKWGVMPSVETFSPPMNAVSHQAYLPTIDSGGLYGDDVARLKPPVFDWVRWGVMPSEETVSPPMNAVSHQAYLPTIDSGGLHGVDVTRPKPPVFEWGTLGVIPSEETESPNADPAIGSGGLDGVNVMDPNNEIDPFDMESFVDRLVDDVPPAQAAYICDAPVAADRPPEIVTKSGNCNSSDSSSAAKLSLQPIHSEPWPEQIPAASAQGTEWWRADDKRSVVPYDTFPGALFAPARVSSPEVAPTVEPAGFMRMLVVDETDGGIRSGNARFEPSAMDNIPPLVEPLPSVERQIPRALVRSDYDDNRHTFLRQQETIHHVGPGYLAGFGQVGLFDPSLRTALVNHVSQLHAAASGGGPPLSLDSLFLAINVMDRFLSTYEGSLVASGGRGGLEVAGSACLAIASKYEDTQSVATSLWGLAVAGTRGKAETMGADELHAARKDIAAMELGVLSALSYRVTVPTALSFLGEFIRRASLVGCHPDGPAAETVRAEAQQILLRVLRDVTWLEHMPSALAAAAWYRVSCTSSPGAALPSSSVVFAVTGYQLEVLGRCLRDMDAVRTGGAAPGAVMVVSGSVEPVLHYPSTRGGPCSVRQVATLPSPRLNHRDAFEGVARQGLASSLC